MGSWKGEDELVSHLSGKEPIYFKQSSLRKDIPSLREECQLIDVGETNESYTFHIDLEYEVTDSDQQ